MTRQHHKFNATEQAYINGAITKQQMLDELNVDSEEELEQVRDKHGDIR